MVVSPDRISLFCTGSSFYFLQIHINFKCKILRLFDVNITFSSKYIKYMCLCGEIFKHNLKNIIRFPAGKIPCLRSRGIWAVTQTSRYLRAVGGWGPVTSVLESCFWHLNEKHLPKSAKLWLRLWSSSWITCGNSPLKVPPFTRFANAQTNEYMS